MKVERVTVTFEIARSKSDQIVKFGLSEEIALEEGDDRDAVVKSARKRLFQEVSDTANRAIAHLVPATDEA